MYLIIVRFDNVDMSRVRQALEDHALDLEAVTQEAYRRGARSHRFGVSQDRTFVVVDVWEDASAFQEFFRTDPRIAQVIDAAGFSGQPQVEVLEVVDAAGTF